MNKYFLLVLSLILGSSVELSALIINDSTLVPAWSKQAVWYQIFPERFSNGDKLNDPAPSDMNGAWPYVVPPDWKISPWTSDWYKLQPWEKADGHDFYWNAGLRRYGGDLQGIINHLDYLKTLGITAIYLTPVFESPSLHKYDTRMYHHIDNNFGPDAKGDEKIWASENPADPKSWKWTAADKLFLKLIKEVHVRSMKLIIDGVFNHVGTTFWAFQDVVKNQQKSEFKDWFIIKSWDNPNTPENEFDYTGWAGVKDLPEIKKDEKTGLIKGFADHIHYIIKRWMDPEGNGNIANGIDGWRLDVAEMINLNFWRQFRIWVKEINPDAYITGEIFWENWQANQMANAAPWLQGDAFDGVMNYRFVQAVTKYIVDVKNQITSKAFADSIKTFMYQYPEENFYAVQNLVDSHDVDRIGSQILNPDRFYDHKANPQQNQDYNTRKPGISELLKQKLIAGIQMTMPGAPMIYYGDEAGMWGGDDPDCRKPMVWKNIKYEPEKYFASGSEHSPDPVSFNSDLFQWYKKLIKIRKENKTLSEGELTFFYINDTDKIIGYKRTHGKETVFMIANNNSVRKSISLETKLFHNGKSNLSDILYGKKIKAKSDHYKINLMPYQLLIFIND
jgi:glycosidase